LTNAIYSATVVYKFFPTARTVASVEQFVGAMTNRKT